MQLPERLHFEGKFGELADLYARTLVLSAATLGLYRFWARTRIRCYLWSHIRYRGDALEYSGTGEELLAGFLKAMAIWFPPFAAISLAIQFVAAEALTAAWTMWHAANALLCFMLYAARYAALQYRMSRTAWQGIRFALGGSPWSYAALAFRGLALTILTLGLYWPLHAVALKRYEIEHLSFGSEPFRFDGRGTELMDRFFAAWLLAPFTLGLSLFGYQAAAWRYYARATRLGALRLRADFTGAQVFRLLAGNAVLLSVSLGLLYPVVLHRRWRLICDHLWIAGRLDEPRIVQAAPDQSDGEGLASFLAADVWGL